MRKLLFITLALVAALSAYAADKIDRLRAEMMDMDSKKVFVISHRGDWRNYPENSLEGVLSAANMGADIVEIDIQRTKDGHLILLHDGTLNRTTTGSGKVSETNLEDIKKLRLRNGTGAHTRFIVPTLEEVLVATKGKVMLNLDKADRYFDQIMELLEKTGTTRQIVMKGGSSPKDVKKHFGKYLDKVIYMPILNLDKEGVDKEIEMFVKEINPVAFEFLYLKDSNPMPKQVAETLKTSKIWYNCLWDTMAGGHDDDMSLVDGVDAGWGYLIDTLNARMLQTDRPEMMVNYLRSRGLHE